MTLKELADAAAQFMGEFDAQLDKLGEQLKNIDPDILEKATKQFGDESTACFILFTPQPELNNKSPLQLWAEQQQGPIKELIKNTHTTN